MGWHRLASHLHTPISVLRKQMTSMDFVKWMVYLEEDIYGFHREDHLFANLQAEMRRSWVKNPSTVNPNSFLIKFKRTPRKKKDINTKTEESKSFWLALVGLDKE